MKPSMDLVKLVSTYAKAKINLSFQYHCVAIGTVRHRNKKLTFILKDILSTFTFFQLLNCIY